MLVAQDNPLDQYLMRHPDFFFDKSVEHALISPSNPYILKGHLLAAAYELPLWNGDADLFGNAFEQCLESLQQEGLLRCHGSRCYPTPAIAYPAQSTNLRSSSSAHFAIVERETGRLLETIEDGTAFWRIHPGAVYLHLGEAYLVTTLDLQEKVAYASKHEEPWYTVAKDFTDIRVLRTLSQKRCGAVQVYLGEVEVSNTVVGFKRKRQVTEEVLDEQPLDLPPRTFRTVALWWDVPEATIRRISHDGLDLAGGLHASEHAAIGLLPLFAMCDRNDIGGVSTPLHPDTSQAQVFIYDGHPGGVGIAEKGYELMSDLWSATLATLEDCPCEAGCPSCVQSPKCGNNNEPLDKEAAKVLLAAQLGNLLARKG